MHELFLLLKWFTKCKYYAVFYFIFDVKGLNYCINYCNTEIPVVLNTDLFNFFLSYDLYILCQM